MAMAGICPFDGVLRCVFSSVLELCLAALPAAAQQEVKVEWGKRAPLIEPNSEMAVAELDGKIYIVGGYPSTRISVRTVQVYDIATDKWRLTTPYPVTINHASAVGLGGMLYVIGGQTNAGTRTEPSRYTDAVYAYDPKTEKWSRRASMPTARSAMAHDVIDGRIYVAGGRPPRGGVNGMAANGCFHTFGGEHPTAGPSGVFPHHEVYNPKTDRWTRLPDNPIPVHGVTGLAYASGWIHLPGGGTKMGGGSGSTHHQVVKTSLRCG